MNENSGLKDNVSSLSNRIEELQSTNQENADNISNYITKINQVEFKVSQLLKNNSFELNMNQQFYIQDKLGKSTTVDRFEVRFGNSTNANEGYVEVNLNGQGWKGVCDDNFGLKEAHVLCRMAGYSDGADKAFTNSKPFGHGASGGKFAIDDLNCTGTEASVFECTHSAWNVHNCAKAEWVGVKCKGSMDQVELRFGNSSNANEGYIEVNINGQGWKGVCDDNFGLKEAHVICRMAGYFEGADKAFTNSKPFGNGASGDDFAIDQLNCTGTELSVVECTHNSWNNENCAKTEWAGVKCKGSSVRLFTQHIQCPTIGCGLFCKF